MKRSPGEATRPTHRALRGGAALLALSSLLAIGSVAPASADTNLGHVVGLSYWSDTTASFPAGSFGGAEARCPKNRRPTGGGILPNGATDEAWLTVSLPVHSRSWLGRFKNASGPAKTAQVLVICSGRNVESQNAFGSAVPPGETEVVKAKCPSGTQVSGGGAGVEDSLSVAESNLVSSYPFDDGDPNDAPDDGWKARVYNFSTDVTAFAAASAQCQPSGKFRYRESTTFIAKCPARHSYVTGGGIKQAKDDAAYAWVNTTSPVDTTRDEDLIPDDGWVGLGRDNTTEKTVYAICFDPLA